MFPGTMYLHFHETHFVSFGGSQWGDTMYHTHKAREWAGREARRRRDFPIGPSAQNGRHTTVCFGERDAVGELYARRRHTVRRCILRTDFVLAAREHRDPVRCLRTGRLLSVGGGRHVRIGAMHAVCVAIHFWIAPDRAMGMAQEVSRCSRLWQGPQIF